jgi:hypothetical protein
VKEKYQEFRRRADICHRLAERAATPELRSAWLRIGRNWLAMIPIEHYESAVPYDDVMQYPIELRP